MNATDTQDPSRVCGEPRRFPSAEEMRMVRAIALLALLEAARHGRYEASFRGFRVEACRTPNERGSVATVDVHLAVTLGEAVVEQHAHTVASPQVPFVHADPAQSATRTRGTHAATESL